MAAYQNRVRRTQEDDGNDARERWYQLFVKASARQCALARIEVPETQGDSDDDDHSAPAPKYYTCLAVQGHERVLLMWNFAPVNFERLWDSVECHVLANWNVNRGKKSASSPKDILFMTLGALEHCGSRDTVSSMFDMSPSPFQKMVKMFLAMLGPFLYETFVQDEAKRWTMKKLTLTGNVFKEFNRARYATDVAFQHSDRPCGGNNDSKKFYSGKHNLYGHKVEVSVLPTRRDINCAEFEPGSIADVTIFRSNGEFRKYAMLKLQNERSLNDEGSSKDRFQDDWAVLIDKEYQGLGTDYRTIQPKEKARGAAPLSLQEQRENDRISHDGVIVENYFGGLKTLWGVCSHKWVWDRKAYNMYFRICVTLTNFNISLNPLRREDGDSYRSA